MAKTLGGVTLPEQIRWQDRYTGAGRGRIFSVLTDISGASNNAVVVEQSIATGREITLVCELEENKVNDWFRIADITAINALADTGGSLSLVWDAESYIVAFREYPTFEPIIGYVNAADESEEYYVGTIPLVVVPA